jgi:hypothetical protein
VSSIPVQVKIAGCRVNLAEVERAVLQCKQIDQVVVMCHLLNDVTSVIVAYYTARDDGGRRPVERDVWERCVTSLPEWGRPKLVRVDHIPLQPHTGKVDRQALKAIYIETLRRNCLYDLKTLGENKTKVFFNHYWRIIINPTRCPVVMWFIVNLRVGLKHSISTTFW